MAREEVLGDQPDDLSSVADRDLGNEGKPALQSGAQLRLRDRPPDDERPCRPDVDRVEVLQSLDEHRGSKGPVTTDVDPAQKNYECHGNSAGRPKARLPSPESCTSTSAARARACETPRRGAGPSPGSRTTRPRHGPR